MLTVADYINTTSVQIFLCMIKTDGENCM